MQKYRILWADDEIDLLKPHILFLGNKGYDVTPVNSGADALEEIENSSFDAVFLDENMPGMSGLETLNYIKASHPSLPVIMITKSEEEHIMEDAIGAKIADYLIKPLNPNQILISIKKILDNERLISEKTNQSYQQEFRNLAMELNEVQSHEEWADLYKRLVYWETEIDNTEDRSMNEVFSMQKNEANLNFAKYITSEYGDWMGKSNDRPLMSHDIIRKKVIPHIGEEPIFLIVIDNLRQDQWLTIEPEILKLFDIESRELYYSILPTTTAYARNSLFAGLTPLQIHQRYPQYWAGEDTDDPKNNFEKELLEELLKRERVDCRSSYHKIIRAEEGKQLCDNVINLLSNPLNAIVYNFVDMLSHARTDVQMIRELAPDEAAYRSLTKTWFDHSSLFDTLKRLSDQKVKIMITTDHGTIRVRRPEKIVGDRNTNTNLRYKQGRNLAFDEDNIFHTRKPEEFQLPKVNFSSTFAFTTEDYFFVYPNNYNHFANLYRDTFQHGGISLEEMIIPFITLSNK